MQKADKSERASYGYTTSAVVQLIIGQWHQVVIAMAVWKWLNSADFGLTFKFCF